LDVAVIVPVAGSTMTTKEIPLTGRMEDWLGDGI
jgi:hypothetical protein